MKVTINQKETDTAATTLSELIEELHLPSRGVAVGAAGRMIPRTEWDSFVLAEGTSLVVIKAAAGG